MIIKLILHSCLILGIPFLILTFVIRICDAELKQCEQPEGNEDEVLTVKEIDNKKV
jgi:hypothetical protein